MNLETKTRGSTELVEPSASMSSLSTTSPYKPKTGSKHMALASTIDDESDIENDQAGVGIGTLVSDFNNNNNNLYNDPTQLSKIDDKSIESKSKDMADTLRNVSFLSFINCLIVFIASIIFRIDAMNQANNNKECCISTDSNTNKIVPFNIHLIINCLLVLILLCLPNFVLFIYNVYDIYKNWYPVLQPTNLNKQLRINTNTNKNTNKNATIKNVNNKNTNATKKNTSKNNIVCINEIEMLNSSNNSEINTGNNSNNNNVSNDNNNKMDIIEGIECESGMYQLIYGILMVIMATLWAVIWTEIDVASFNDQVCCKFIKNDTVLDWSLTLFLIDTCLAVYYVIVAFIILFKALNKNNGKTNNKKTNKRRQ